ncbi:MAG TPA: hypothetical protein PK364_06940, partial [Synergistaceae bacterium]|nr:hypothetical protein [Synergistaceae bacterium]
QAAASTAAAGYSIGVVVGIREKDLFRPQVLLQLEADDVSQEEYRFVDLHNEGTELFVHKVLGCAKKRSLQEPAVSGV